jgi:hypothetical protein
MQIELDNLTKNTHLSPSLSYRLPDSFFNIINFTPVINHIYNLCVEKVSELNSDLDFKKSLHKKYIYHYFILYSCEYLKLCNKKYKPVVYFDVSNELNLKFTPILTIFSKNFPILIIQSSSSFNNYKKTLKCDGTREELVICLMRKLFKLQLKRFYFSKLHYFCSKYDLTFLDKTYFNDMRNKLSLL